MDRRSPVSRVAALMDCTLLYLVRFESKQNKSHPILVKNGFLFSIHSYSYMRHRKTILEERGDNGSTYYYASLLPSATANRSYDIADYGTLLSDNKWHVTEAFRKKGLSSELRHMFFGMAFQETDHMTSAERDTTKDWRTDGSTNWTLWNLSEDLLAELGYKATPGRDRETFRKLNDKTRIGYVVSLMKNGVQKWGARRFLAFVRGGRTAFDNESTYDVGSFVDAIATHMKVLQDDPDLFWDKRRTEIAIKHV